MALLHRAYFYLLGFMSFVMLVLGVLTIYYNINGQRTEAIVALCLLMSLVLLSFGSLMSYFFCYWQNPAAELYFEERNTTVRDYY